MPGRTTSHPDSLDEFLTPTEVAALLKIRRETVYRLCSSGVLRSIRLGDNTRRIRRTDLDAYLDDLAAA
jgi:excisionase family DNA binding protein